MAKLPCYHVMTTNGSLYGVAATTQREALQMTQDRLTSEDSNDKPWRAMRVDTWDADYGTVLQYS